MYQREIQALSLRLCQREAVITGLRQDVQRLSGAIFLLRRDVDLSKLVYAQADAWRDCCALLEDMLLVKSVGFASTGTEVNEAAPMPPEQP